MPEAPVEIAAGVAPQPAAAAETAPGKRVEEAAPELGESPTDGETKGAGASASPLKARTVSVGGGPSGADARKMLVEGEQMLRAQRFAEARDIFSKLTKTKGTRGRVLVALAEIAFQEKNYEETIRSATLAADRGGGARARVLLGDAHFRLSHFQDAVTAYGQALRLDPENASAKAGLALASKRM
jgi:Flp pilus assembly protein TadD